MDALSKIWFFSLLFWAASLPGSEATPRYDWSDRVSTYRVYWDDPRALLAEGAQLLAVIDPAKEPVRWLQVFCAYGMSNDSIHQMPGLDRHLITAKRIATRSDLWPWMIDALIIEGAFVESLTESSPPEVVAAFGLDVARPYEEALSIAQKHGSKRDRYLVIRNYMGYLRNKGQSTRVLELLANAPRDLQDAAELTDIDRLQLKKNLIYVYKIVNQDQRVVELQKELVEGCDSLPLRSFCAYMLYDYGVLLSSGRMAVDYPRAMEALKKGEIMAKDVNDESILSLINFMLAEISHKRGKSEEALVYAQYAAEISRKIGYFSTVGEASLLAAESLRRLNRQGEALNVLIQLNLELPDNLYRYKSRLHHMLADLHEDRGDWRKAYEEKKLQIDFEKKYLEERGQEMFSEQMVKLGLQLEQEKNKTLVSENELRERQQKTVMYGILAVIVIALFLLLGLLWVSSKNREIRKLHHYIETQVLQRFLPPKIVGEILEGKSRFGQEAQNRVVTVLFADLVNFTESAERMRPQDLSSLLNRFFAEMSEVVFEHGGVIDKFIGDAIMVVFGAPQDMTPHDQAAAATSCALHMLQHLQSLNQDWQKQFNTTFAMRVGIHQGSAVVGTFGSERRSDYTVIGHTVNLASRIEGQALPNQILITESVAGLLPKERMKHAGSFRLKGIEQPVTLYAVMDPGTHQQKSHTA